MNNLLLFIAFSLSLFDIKLNDVEFDKYDKAIFIVCDEIFCSSCLAHLIMIKEIWEPEFETYLITNSKKNKTHAYTRRVFFKSKYSLDSLLFVEDYYEFLKAVSSQSGTPELSPHSPFMIIKTKKNISVIDYKVLFKKGYTKSSLKKAVMPFVRKK